MTIIIILCQFSISFTEHWSVGLVIVKIVKWGIYIIKYTLLTHSTLNGFTWLHMMDSNICVTHFSHIRGDIGTFCIILPASDSPFQMKEDYSSKSGNCSQDSDDNWNQHISTIYPQRFLKKVQVPYTRAYSHKC